jgi:voltage-gated potassium channel
MKEVADKSHLSGWRKRMFEVIFEADTRAGKIFDVVLIVCIAVSVAGAMLATVDDIHNKHKSLLKGMEIFFTALFTVEYVLRLICVGRPVRYATSFFGVVDLVAILPTYLSFIFPVTSSLRIIRLLRVLRIFRVLKLSQCVGEANHLMNALAASRRKIFVFLFAVMIMVVMIGSLMYVVEGEVVETGFTSIPKSIYWAVVTLTTVGYGDISPQTPLGQFLAAMVMVMGYSIIAVPTGIVTSEMTKEACKGVTTQACPRCLQEGHDKDANHCKFCGSGL